MSKSINDIYKYLEGVEGNEDNKESSKKTKSKSKNRRSKKSETESDAPSILEAYRKLVNY